MNSLSSPRPRFPNEHPALTYNTVRSRFLKAAQTCIAHIRTQTEIFLPCPLCLCSNVIIQPPCMCVHELTDNSWHLRFDSPGRRGTSQNLYTHTCTGVRLCVCVCACDIVCVFVCMSIPLSLSLSLWLCHHGCGYWYECVCVCVCMGLNLCAKQDFRDLSVPKVFSWTENIKSRIPYTENGVRRCS